MFMVPFQFVLAGFWCSEISGTPSLFLSSGADRDACLVGLHQLSPDTCGERSTLR